ncbi:MAG TPA: Smr/MutS family protein [Candidatus Baltobacteraceae bacterium]|nr:Smr/MutS family protein [Candidatus Baltobacteraceae bacterium]
MSRPAEELLEFDRLKNIVGGFTTCAPGRRAVQALVPQQDAAALGAEFELVREAIAYLRAGSELGFGSLADPAAWLARLVVPGSALTIAELLDAVSLMEIVGGVRQTFRGDAAKYPRIAERAAALADFRHISTAIHRAILPNGEISDDASPQLKRIRAGMGQAREKIQRSLEGILRARGESSGEKGEDYITLRNDRFVIPVRASERRSVPGVVHGASGTGQTIFVEPLEAIDLNNRLVQLSDEEIAEIARILEDLTERVRLEREPLDAAAAEIAHLDSIFARARFAREFDCTVPEFSHSNSLRLEAARNPVLEATLRPQGLKAVPLGFALGGGETVMVISGPNTGGKTVALKTTGLAALSAQSAIPVAADRAELPIFDRVLADIGDEQSIAANLSTFSAHMLNLKSMLDVATERSLILVDEMGTGTAPEEGAALAVALLEEFRRRRALTLATTHHDRLKAYASTTPGIVNAAMEFDEEHLRPTYRLLVGVPGTSSGIEIARRLGLPARVVEHAQASLSPESREARDLIAYLHRSRDEMEDVKRQAREELAQLEEERRSLQTEWIERQRKRIAELEKSFREAQKRLEAEVARMVEDVKDRALRAQLEKQTGRRMGKFESDARAEADAAVVETLAASQADLGVAIAAQQAPVAPELLSPGLRIMVKGFKQPVVFQRHDGRSAEVQAGPLRMKVPLADIVAIESDTPAAKGPAAAAGARQRGITVHAQPGSESAPEEINVIGHTVEEATERVDKFLDDAALAGRSSVRIIHGHGTGALRRGLAEFFAAHPLVERVHAEEENRGGTAITIVELKA